MHTFERFITRAIFSVAMLFATNIVLYFFNKQIPISIITILFAALFGWPAVLIMVVAIYFL